MTKHSLDELLEFVQSELASIVIDYQAEIVSLLNAKIALNPSINKNSVLEMVQEYLLAKKMKYDGLATDHDGTLIPIDKRDADMPATITELLNRLLAKGKYLIVISGRGDSIWKCLDKLNLEYHNRVYHAMYNGGLIVNYADKDYPVFKKIIEKEHEIVELLKGDEVLKTAGAIITPRTYMIRIKLNANSDILVNHIKRLLVNEEVSVSSSGWAVDVTPKGIDKDFALRTIQNVVPELAGKQFVKLGDKGGTAGNDYTLLRNKYSFSVDEISDSVDSCFPVINSKGQILKGVSATEYFLNSIT